MDQGIQKWPSKICGGQPVKIWGDMVCFDMVYLSKPYHFKFLTGSLPQIVLRTFLNTLNHMQIVNWNHFFGDKIRYEWT